MTSDQRFVALVFDALDRFDARQKSAGSLNDIRAALIDFHKDVKDAATPAAEKPKIEGGFVLYM